MLLLLDPLSLDIDSRLFGFVRALSTAIQAKHSRLHP